MSLYDYIGKLLEQTENLDKRLREVEIKLDEVSRNKNEKSKRKE